MHDRLAKPEPWMSKVPVNRVLTVRMPEKLFGIPSHPLMVHLPVVLLPLCALIALVLAVRPSLVRHYGWPFLGLSLVATVGTVLAASSGEGLEELLNERSDAIEQHAEWGDRTRLVAIVFFVLAVAFVYLVKRSQQRSTSDSTGSTHTVVKRSPAIPVFAALLFVSAIGATASVIYTGHTGAKSAWEDAGKEGGGEGGGD
jgi:uncharacterized membrane protein